MLTFDIPMLEEAGLTDTGREYAGRVAPHYWIRQQARALDVTLASVHVYRVAPNTWRLFLRPDAKPGYQSVPVLNF